MFVFISINFEVVMTSSVYTVTGRRVMSSVCCMPFQYSSTMVKSTMHCYKQAPSRYDLRSLVILYLKTVSLKSIQSQMSLVVSDIVLKNKFAIKRYEIVLYTCNI